MKLDPHLESPGSKIERKWRNLERMVHRSTLIIEVSKYEA